MQPCPGVICQVCLKDEVPLIVPEQVQVEPFLLAYTPALEWYWCQLGV